MLSLLAVLFLWSPALADEKPVLTVYAYDSFAAKGGLGPEVARIFEKTCGCTLKILPSGDGAQLVSRMQIDAERGKFPAQAVVGLDEPTFERAKKMIEPWGKWVPKGFGDLDPVLATKNKDFLPFDYGYFAFMADRQALGKQAPPAQLSDLLRPEWRRNFILEDPRTSTPGLAFLLFTQKIPMGFDAFWSQLRSQWLTIAQGWDAAYGLFLKKEAPLVWSYTTSQAYHEEHGDDPAHRRYQAVVFAEGLPLQIEGAALIRGGASTPLEKKLARAFLESLISSEVQSLVAKTNWMYPARDKVALPPSFERLPMPSRVVTLPRDPHEIDQTLKRWSQQVEGAR